MPSRTDFIGFIKDFESSKQEFRDWVITFPGKIAFYGAAAKGITFLNTVNFSSHKYLYIVDDAPTKHGKFAPGIGLPIVPFSELEKNRPDVIVILAWNLRDAIIEKLKSTDIPTKCFYPRVYGSFTR